MAPSPEGRAYLEPIFGKLAAPGMCNPEDDTPAPRDAVAEVIELDTRTLGNANTTLYWSPSPRCVDVRRVGSTQRVAGHRDPGGHRFRVRGRHRKSHHRGRVASADARRHPAGVTFTAVPGGVRRCLRATLMYFRRTKRCTCHRRSAAGTHLPGPGLHLPGVPSASLRLPGPSRQTRLRPGRPDQYR